MIRHQLETSSQMAQMSPEQREQSVQMAAKYAPISGYVGVLLGVPLGTLLWPTSARFRPPARAKAEERSPPAEVRAGSESGLTAFRAGPASGQPSSSGAS